MEKHRVTTRAFCARAVNAISEALNLPFFLECDDGKTEEIYRKFGCTAVGAGDAIVAENGEDAVLKSMVAMRRELQLPSSCLLVSCRTPFSTCAAQCWAVLESRSQVSPATAGDYVSAINMLRVLIHVQRSLRQRNERYSTRFRRDAARVCKLSSACACHGKTLVHARSKNGCLNPSRREAFY